MLCRAVQVWLTCGVMLCRAVQVSYTRKAFGQTGDGHFSPIGGYHSARDLVLILDTVCHVNQSTGRQHGLIAHGTCWACLWMVAPVASCVPICQFSAPAVGGGGGHGAEIVQTCGRLTVGRWCGGSMLRHATVIIEYHITAGGFDDA